MTQTASFRAGSGEPLVLLHIGANPWKKWENCLPALTARYDVFIPTYAGFEGGPPLRAPATINILTDLVVAELDSAGIGTAHVVGNSLGGWIAMELARRGRARSAIALSPAGGWITDWGRMKVQLFFRLNTLFARLVGRRKLYFLRNGWIRKLALRGAVEHGDRLTPHQAVALADDSMRGANVGRMLHITRDSVQPYPDPGVPTLVAWSERDRLTPLRLDGEVWRAAAPYAEWRVLPGVGHMPMFDAPEQTTELVLDWLAKAEGKSAAS